MSHLNINGVDKPLDHVYVKARTENLFDADRWYRAYKLPDGIYQGTYAQLYTIKAKPFSADDIGRTFTFSMNLSSTQGNVRVCANVNGTVVNGTTNSSKKTSIVTFTVETVNDTIFLNYGTLGDTVETMSNIMLNTGSTPLPYEPYLITKEAWEARTRVTLHCLTNPLCGIGTYKDTLDLSTGTVTRYVKKLVLTGEETWNPFIREGWTTFYTNVPDGMGTVAVSTHFKLESLPSGVPALGGFIYNGTTNHNMVFRMSDDTTITTETAFKQYLRDQYSAGTPVTVWYVLATPTTETITVPSHLTGIVEGYLTQDSTPSPASPVYPTANGTLEQGGTYSLDTGAYAIAWGRADTFTGTNSISARCYGLPVKSWEIDGNSRQSGAPSPQSIIMPTFCGVRTGNLWANRGFSARAITSTLEHTDANTYGTALSTTVGKEVIVTQSVYPTGDVGYQNGFFFIDVDFSKYEIGDKITLSFDYIVNEVHALSSQTATILYVGKNNNGVSPMLSSGDWKISGRLMAVITIIADMKPYVEVRLCGNSITVKNIMLNTGSTAKPYEPYGYKLTITSAGQTAPVYLGEVQTVRKVKKLVLTGEETWNQTGGDDNPRFYTFLSDAVANSACFCSHFVDGQASLNGACDIAASKNLIINNSGLAYNVADFKSYLAAQYANGTPVTVWYVLATPETGIVNEPLAKIGDYADTLTSDQAGVIIPTVGGNNTISVDTTLSPSRFEVKVHAKPIPKPIHYGFKIDKSISDPSNAVIYTHDAVKMTPAGMNFSNQVFDYGSWRNVWFVKNAKPCALNFNGTVDYYLDPNDYTKKLDGTPSDIQYTLLSTEPSDWSTQWKQYYHIVSGEYVLLDSESAPTFVSNTYYKMTCTYTSGNFMTQFPKVWVKRYEDTSYNYFEFADTKLDSDFQDDAFVDASGVHKDCIYLPMFKGSIVDSKLRSIPGMIPERQTTAVEELTYAQNCGAGWQYWDFSTKELLTDLMVLISKNTDSQSKFGEGRSAGYDPTEETTNGLLQTGTLVKKGAFFGDGTAWPNSLKDMKVWHCEGFYANRWERELGIIADGTGYKYKATPPYNFTGDGYTTVSGVDPAAVNGYVKTIATFAGGSVPKIGSDNYSDALFRDYYYPYNSGTCIMIRGGTFSSGTAAGVRGGSIFNEASKRHVAIGASPVYK